MVKALKIGDVVWTAQPRVKKFEAIKMDKSKDMHIVYLCHFDGSCSEIFYANNLRPDSLKNLFKTSKAAYQARVEEAKQNFEKEERFYLKSFSNPSSKKSLNL